MRMRRRRRRRKEKVLKKMSGVTMEDRFAIPT